MKHRKNIKPTYRKRIYETGIAIFSILTIWGVVDANDAEHLAEALDTALAAAGFILARVNTPSEPRDPAA